MKALYDDSEITLSQEYVAALKALLRAELVMMRKADRCNADCWTWGTCIVGNFSDARNLTFEFGGDDDKPAEMRGDVRVVTNTRSGAGT